MAMADTSIEIQTRSREDSNDVEEGRLRQESDSKTCDSAKQQGRVEQREDGNDEDQEAAANAMDIILGIPPYASPLPPFTYIVETLAIAFQSSILSLFALGYLNAVYEVPKLWFSMQGNEAYPEDPSTTTFLAGNLIWIGIGSLTGLLVGILKAFIFKFDDYNGFIDELVALESDPKEAVKVSLTCLVSLFGGASVGPESGLGSASGGLSALWARVVNKLCRWAEGGSSTDGEARKEEEERRTKLIILCGMVAAFSTILPTPASAILLCVELPGFETLSSKHGLPYLKTISQATVSGTISFLVFDYFFNSTYLSSQAPLPGFLHEYTNADIYIAMGFGVMGAALALSYFVIGGLVKGIVEKVKKALDDKFGKNCRIVTLGIIGGTIFGTMGYIFPLTLGDGSYQLGTVIRNGESISTSVLISSAFVKMLTFWVSKECGFVGGLFYPLLIISSMTGRVFVNEFDAPWAISMACSLVALAAAFTPMPFAMMMLAISAFNLSSRGGIPTLVCVVVAHMLFVGIGFPQKLMSMKKKKDA